MGAPDLLEHLYAAGLTLAIDGERLTVTPRGRLTDEMRQAIRESKRELMALLAGNRSASSQAAYWPNSSAMSDAEIDRFERRLIQFKQRGLADDRADRLADWLMLRDRRKADHIS